MQRLQYIINKQFFESQLFLFRFGTQRPLLNLKKLVESIKGQKLKLDFLHGPKS